jgi:hypothetical protein
VVEKFDFDFLRSMYKPINNVVVLYVSECALNSILIGKSKVNMTVFINNYKCYIHYLRKWNEDRNSSVNDKLGSDVKKMRLYLMQKLDIQYLRIHKYTLRGFKIDIPLDYFFLDRGLSLV